MNDHYEHGMVEHLKMYVDGQIHRNLVENFWILLKPVCTDLMFPLNRFMSSATLMNRHFDSTIGEWITYTALRSGCARSLRPLREWRIAPARSALAPSQRFRAIATESATADSPKNSQTRSAIAPAASVSS